MKKKVKLFLRDMLFLAIFLLLVGIAARKSAKFLKVHKESIIHELDNELLQQSEILQELCKKFNRVFGDHIQQDDATEIEGLCKKIVELEEIYKKNSNALILLGPIGTISIVLKERQVKADLLVVTKQLISIINRYVSEQKQHTKEITSTDEGIGILQKILS